MQASVRGRDVCARRRCEDDRIGVAHDLWRDYPTGRFFTNEAAMAERVLPFVTRRILELAAGQGAPGRDLL